MIRSIIMGKDDGGGKGPAGLTDARFAKMYSDPRFQRFPQKKGKVEIDSRFASEQQRRRRQKASGRRRVTAAVSRRVCLRSALD